MNARIRQLNARKRLAMMVGGLTGLTSYKPDPAPPLSVGGGGTPTSLSKPASTANGLGSLMSKWGPPQLDHARCEAQCGVQCAGRAA